MSRLASDVRFTLRGWNEHPGATMVMILALALGIGVNVSGFINVEATILHPFAFPGLDRIMTVWEAPVNLPAERGFAAPANFLDWKEQSRSFESLAAYRAWDASLTGTGDPERLQAFQVTPDYFPLLGLKPRFGRTFRSDEADDAGAHVIVVSNGFWKRHLASSADPLGRVVTLNGQAFTVIGVMTEEFNFPLETDAWVPLSLDASRRHDRQSHNLAVLARLKPGIELSQAKAELTTLSARLAGSYPDTNANRGVSIVPIVELGGDIGNHFMLTLLATAGFVLLLASANVANLLLVRMADRKREVAIRTAMGASRLQIVRQLVTESILIGLAAGAVGLCLASWNLNFTHLLIPEQVYRWVAGLRNMRVDTPVILATLAMSLLSGMLCVAPALLQVLRDAAGLDLCESLKEGGRGGTAGMARSQTRTILAVTEVALALILLSGAGVMVRTFQRLLTVNTGYNKENLLTLKIALPTQNYSNNALVLEFYDRLLRGLRETPAAREAAIRGHAAPAQGVYIEGRGTPRPGEPVPSIESVSGRYFDALGLPILHGRGISDNDGTDRQPVAVISESVARYYWPDSNPIGHRVRLHPADSRWLTVVGVSGDVKDWFSGRPQPAAYVSFAQDPHSGVSIFIRTSADPMGLAGAVRSEVRKLDRSQPIYDLKSMDQVITEETSGVRAAAVMMLMYALIALVLAALGIYAVVSYSVTQRTHEIGIRMAVGAAPREILTLTLKDAARIGAIGLGIGVPVALLLIQLMSSVLYGVVHLEAMLFAGITSILAFATVLAGFIPALRASRLDPVTALRHE